MAAGITNMILDALLVAVLSLGLPGAATATAISQCVGGLVPLIYFCRPNTSLLRLTSTRYDGRDLDEGVLVDGLIPIDEAGGPLDCQSMAVRAFDSGSLVHRNTSSTVFLRRACRSAQRERLGFQ